MKKLILSSVVLFFAYGVKAQSLTGTKWKLTAIYDDTHQNKLNDLKKECLLQFEGDSLYSGSFCNTFKGKYRFKNDKYILMKTPSRTKISCGPEIDELERKLFTYFGVANVFIREEGELSLISDKGKLVFVKQ